MTSIKITFEEGNFTENEENLVLKKCCIKMELKKDNSGF